MREAHAEGKEAQMRPIRLSGGGVDCYNTNCPAVYIDADKATDDHEGDLLIQGYEVSGTEVLAALGPLPDGERLVRVPRAVIAEAAQRMLAGEFQ